jgi:hypothetical protein
MWEVTNIVMYKILDGMLPEGKELLGRPRRGQDKNIKIDLKKERRGGVDLINLAQVNHQRRVLVNTK